jgi:hypothetical protein
MKQRQPTIYEVLKKKLGSLFIFWNRNHDDDDDDDDDDRTNLNKRCAEKSRVLFCMLDQLYFSKIVRTFEREIDGDFLDEIEQLLKYIKEGR